MILACLQWGETYFRPGEGCGEQVKVFAFLELTETGDRNEQIRESLSCNITSGSKNFPQREQRWECRARLFLSRHLVVIPGGGF